MNTFKVLTCGRNENPFAAVSSNMADAFRSRMGLLRIRDGDGSSRAFFPKNESSSDAILVTNVRETGMAKRGRLGSIEFEFERKTDERQLLEGSLHRERLTTWGRVSISCRAKK